jgi:ubiquinone biosynthesis accessory factor UbiK
LVIDCSRQIAFNVQPGLGDSRAGLDAASPAYSADVFLQPASHSPDATHAPRRARCRLTECREDLRMIDLKAIDDLARKLSELVPPGLKEAGADIEKNMKATLQAGLLKLDLVTREEFEVQRAVLLRSREKIDALERAVQVLEAKLATPPDGTH